MPSQHTQYIVEKRRPDGSLDLSDPQPPFLQASYNQIADHYFRHHPCTCGKPLGTCRCTATQEEIRAWYREQGFTWREKTW